MGSPERCLSDVSRCLPWPQVRLPDDKQEQRRCNARRAVHGCRRWKADAINDRSGTEQPNRQPYTASVRIPMMRPRNAGGASRNRSTAIGSRHSICVMAISGNSSRPPSRPSTRPNWITNTRAMRG
jgi:hypothetical protein